MNKFMEEWMEYAKGEGDGSLSCAPPEKPQLIGHLSFDVQARTAKAYRILLNYDGDIVELWFPKAAVEIHGNQLSIAEWFHESFKTNLEIALQEQT